MAAASINRWFSISRALTWWAFGMYFVVLAMCLAISFTRPVWIGTACIVAIAASLLVAALSTLAGLIPNRMLRLLTKHQFMVCTRCCVPIDAGADQLCCPQCGSTCSAEELQMEWGLVLGGHRKDPHR